MNSVPSIGRDDFVREFQARFPEIAADIGDIEDGLLHLEMAVLSHATNGAVVEGRWSAVAEHFAFTSEIFARGNADLRNAVAVSYLENVFIGESSASFVFARSMLPVNLAVEMDLLEAHFAMLANAQSAP